MIRSCYIHIPFCESICSYCDFCKMLYQKKLVDSYLDQLEKEIISIYQGEVLKTIYIGGGTPSCLSDSQLERLFSIISILRREDDVEITIEGNIESTTIEKLLLYKKYGVNRLSFGIESTCSENLSFLERNFSKKKTEEVIATARELGFSNINLDLMYALPGENIEMVISDLSFLLSLEVEHISTYSLMIEDHTKLGINGVKNISEDIDFTMYETISKILKENDYDHYEISNFCKKGYYSRHNMCYWNNEEYYGFGLGACSYIRDRRISNTRSFTDYMMGHYQKEVEIVNKRDQMEYEILLNLRKKEGISLLKFQDKYYEKLKKLYDYSNLILVGSLKEEEDFLFIPEDKWYISNEIIVQLLGCEIDGK